LGSGGILERRVATLALPRLRLSSVFPVRTAILYSGDIADDSRGREITPDDEKG
jgi:hypothetical protein